MERLRATGRGPGLQRALALVLILTGVAMATNLDVRFQSAIAKHLPAALVDPTHSLETSHAVSSRLDRLRRPSRFAVAATGHQGVAEAKLPRLGVAPDFTGNQRWFNTPGGRPLSLKALRGKVVLVDFWTYTCINCLRTLPYLEAWDARYRADGLVIVGVHSPEFPFEQDAGNVAAAVKREGIRYPVAQDNALKTWNAWGNQYWPADYLIDAKGEVRDAHFGEGAYDKTEMAIRALLVEAGRPHPGAMAAPKGAVHPTRLSTPETYVGLARAERFDPPPLQGTPHLRGAVGARDEPLRTVGHLARGSRRRHGRGGRRDPCVDRGQGRLPRAQPPAAGRGHGRRRARWTPHPARNGPAPTSTAAWCASIASACTTWSRRPRPSTTCSRCGRRPESRPTPSRSDSVAPVMLATAPALPAVKVHSYDQRFAGGRRLG